MSEVLERTLNAGVAPRRIVLGHAHDESANRGQNTTTAGSLFRIRPLARHQLPVPAQQRVWRNDRRQVTQDCPAPRTLENPKLDARVKFRGSQVSYSGPRPARAGGPLEPLRTRNLTP